MTVRRMLGHASTAMTLAVYADLFEDDADAVASALDEARARATVGEASLTDAETPGNR